MLPYLHLGPLLLQTPGLALLLGIWAGSWLAEKEAVKLNIKSDLINNILFIGLACGLVGARLTYAITYLDAYLASPLSLFEFNTNSLSPVGGLMIGLLAAFIYMQRKGLKLRPILDALAPGLAVFMVFLGLAHLAGGDAYGSPTHLPWGIFLAGEYRHPTQIYETLLAAGVLIISFIFPTEKRGTGLNFLTVLFFSTAARIFVEAFRGDSVIMSGGFREAQVIGLLVLVVLIIVMREWGQPAKNAQKQDLNTIEQQ
jgi:phosphatidylglycerol---prolipoprotein diacylglyceryl transferase